MYKRQVLSRAQDKINTFWEISKKELDDRKAELRNKDREGEELEERHQVEIKVYKQKVKHLLYEHQNNGARGRRRPWRAARCGRARAGRHRTASADDPGVPRALLFGCAAQLALCAARLVRVEVGEPRLAHRRVSSVGPPSLHVRLLHAPR